MIGIFIFFFSLLLLSRVRDRQSYLWQVFNALQWGIILKTKCLNKKYFSYIVKRFGICRKSLFVEVFLLLKCAPLLTRSYWGKDSLEILDGLTL